MNGIMIQLGWDKKDKKFSHIHFVPFVRRGKSEKEREETCLPKENAKNWSRDRNQNNNIKLYSNNYDNVLPYVFSVNLPKVLR